MKPWLIGAQGVANLATFLSRFAVVVTLIAISSVASAQTTDQIPPSPPVGLVATAASCGQVDLSWGVSTDTGGSGLKAYVISRSDNVSTAIGASRTTFSDTNLVKSSAALTFSVVAQDNAGNKSTPSNSVTV